MLVTEDLRELIGRTPLFRLKRLFPDNEVYAKLEFKNLMSVKDRPVLSMITAGIEDGSITPETEVIEASSGNTAIAIALLGAVLDFKVRIYMSELASEERRGTGVGHRRSCRGRGERGECALRATDGGVSSPRV